MSTRNTSDLIEEYLKRLLAKESVVEIRRREMAERFEVVPSAINYVINTRFTQMQGYIVASKRGGGGFIRIEKMLLINEKQLLERMKKAFGEKLCEKDAISLSQKLYEEQIVTLRERNLMLSALRNTEVLTDVQEADKLRANLMRIFLNRLSYA